MRSLINRFFHSQQKVNIMSAIESLNEEIAQAEAAAEAAHAQITQAKEAYDAAIEAGNVDAADEALQQQTQAERQRQIHTDRAGALETRREAAERQDLTPAALQAIKAAQEVIEIEQTAISGYHEAMKTLEASIAGLNKVFGKTDAALLHARESVAAAHLIGKRPGAERPGFSDSGERLHQLRQQVMALRQNERGFQAGQSMATILSEQDALTYARRQHDEENKDKGEGGTVEQRTHWATTY